MQYLAKHTLLGNSNRGRGLGRLNLGLKLLGICEDNKPKMLYKFALSYYSFLWTTVFKKNGYTPDILNTLLIVTVFIFVRVSFLLCVFHNRFETRH